MIRRKIVKINTVIYKNSYWFVVSCRLESDGVYVMEAVRLRSGDYAPFRGRAYRSFVAARPEDITIMDDADAVKMNEIYNARGTML